MAVLLRNICRASTNVITSGDVIKMVEIRSHTPTQEMKYTYIIEAGPNNYSAYVPDLPGCVTTGSTLEELRERMTEAIQFHIEGLQRHGMTVPQPTTLFDAVEVRV
jgi:predicted RNase H-like HicB family nuclease